MKKHVYILLVLLIPLLAQRSERKASLSKPSDNAEALFQQTSAGSVPRRISYQGILTKNNGNYYKKCALRVQPQSVNRTGVSVFAHFSFKGSNCVLTEDSERNFCV